MTLSNKWIAEGMRVTNGKQVWKVIYWNDKYTDALLQKIDRNGKPTDDYVIAEYYELYGTDKEPQISWMNGKYFDANTTDEAYDVFVGWLVGDKKKSIKERSEENEIIVSELQDTVEYFCGLFEDEGELKGRALESLQNAVERLEIFNAIGSIYQWGVEVLNKCGIKYKGLKESKKSLKESKEYFVGAKTAQGFEIYMIEDGKKYYLSKLAKNIEDSSWSSDHTYAKHWKDKSRAEEVVDMLNSELKESKKSFKEEINRSTWGKWVVKNTHHIEYFFNGDFVNKKTLQSLFESEGFDTDVDTVEDEIKKAVRSARLGNLDGNALHIAHNSVGNRIDLVFNVGGLIGDVESLSKAIDECVIRINGDIYEQDEMWNFGFAIYLTCDIYPMDLSLAESKKKSVRKCLKESVDYEVFAVFPTKNGFIVNTDIKDYQYIQIVNDKITKHSAWREDWFANAKKRAGFKDFDEDDMEERLLARYEKTVRKIIDDLGIDKLNESLTESAKPINEKNVAKFVDELNEWCDDNVHFKDLESAKYTKEYGKLYDFEWGWDYSYGDKGLIKVWDNEGTLDWFEETRVKDFIVKLAKKYGWYAEPVTNDSDFTFAEL